MLKKFVFVLGCFMVSYGAASAETLFARDSIGVKTQNGKPYITHKVKPGETLYALSRKYGVPVAKIVEANKNVEKSLVVGQLVLIPVKQESTAAAKVTLSETAASPAANRTYVVDAQGNKMHTVQARQTLYSISRQHNVSVEDIKKWNKLSNATVEIGQNLIVGVGAKVPAQTTTASKVYVPENDDVISTPKQQPATVTASTAPVSTPAPAAASSVRKNTPSPEKTEAEEEKSSSKTSEYVARVNESGMAEQIEQRGDANKFLALHKTAAVGTIMAVKNPMNDQTVYVRVIGKLPATGENDKLVVKLSKKACQQIGAVDKRFRVEVSYMP
ncbi:LysM peptidoglycan-binding domain-containing protein [Rufibacter soli]